MSLRQSAPVFPALLLGLAGAASVLLGAFGAHALRGHVDAHHAQVWDTAVRYQFWHVLAWAVAAFAAPRTRSARVAGACFGVGIVLFSGSLYALALGAPRWIGLVTPFGGVVLVVGWLALGQALRARGRD